MSLGRIGFTYQSGEAPDIMLAIQNFGMIWERRYIDFGRQKVAGRLLGTNKNHKNELVDFRDQSGIYVLYDENKKIVYIGQTGSGAQKLLKRLRNHDDDHLWNRWSYFSWFGFCKVNKDRSLSLADRADRKLKGNVGDALDEIEAVLLQVIEPGLNKQGPRWSGAEKFYQEWDKELEEPRLRDLIESQEQTDNRLKEIQETLDRLEQKSAPQ